MISDAVFTDPPPKIDLGLVFALHVFDGTAREIGWDQLDGAQDGMVWLHLDRSSVDAQRWLRGQSGIARDAVEALLEEDTRPRVAAFGDDRLVILRGLNLNPGAEQTDLIALRCLVTQDRLITLRLHRVMAVRELRQRITREPEQSWTPGAIVTELTTNLVTRIEPVVAQLRDSVDQLEERDTAKADRDTISKARRDAIFLRRYLAPQRDAVQQLAVDRSALFTDDNRIRLREQADSLTRATEDLDSARDRAAVLSEQAAASIAEELNRRTYTLTVIAAIFLPLGFITGLLGVNVGGIPLQDSPLGFTLVCGGLLVLTALVLLIVRRLGWL